MGQTDGIDDRIADAIVSGTTYDRLRVCRFSYFNQPLPTKLAWQSALLFSLSLVAPLAALYPDSVTATVPGGDPLSASPVIVLVGAFAVGIELVASFGHVAVAVSVLRRESDLTERDVRVLLTVEDAASLLGLWTGALACAATLAYVLLGHAGIDAIAAYVSAGGRNPLDPSGTGVSVALVAGVAFAGSVACYAASRYLDGRL